jgi:hypothetical protein
MLAEQVLPAGRRLGGAGREGGKGCTKIGERVAWIDHGVSSADFVNDVA